MNRKQFLKSLVVLPIVGFLGINKVFAKDENKDVIENNPYKLRFVDSKNKKIDKIIIIQNVKFFNPSHCEKIISLVGDDFYCMDYISTENRISICNNATVFRTRWLGENRDKIKSAIVGHKLDWWSPVKFLPVEKQYTIDIDFIKDKSKHLTKEDQKTIRSSLNYKIKEKENA